MFDLKQTLQKRKENRWPQSNYTSGTAGCPCVCFTLVFVGIVSTTRAFCHLPAGLIRVLQSYVVSERSPTPQEAADMDTLRTPHCVVFSVSSTSEDGEDHLSLVLLGFFLSVCRVFIFPHKRRDSRLRSEVDITVSRLQWHSSCLLQFLRPRPSETDIRLKDCTKCPQLPHYLLGCLCPHVELAHSASLL